MAVRDLDGAPAIAALLFTKVAFALVTKLIPQMNIMIVAFPVQIVIGLIFFGLTLNILLRFVENYLGGLDVLLINTMRGLKGYQVKDGPAAVVVDLGVGLALDRLQ